MPRQQPPWQAAPEGNHHWPAEQRCKGPVVEQDVVFLPRETGGLDCSWGSGIPV